MSRITKWVAVALLVAAGSAFSGTTASAAEHRAPVQAAYRVHRAVPHGGWYYGWNHRYYRPNYRWHRR